MGVLCDLGALDLAIAEAAEVAQYAHDVAGKCMSLIYTKGG